MDRKEIERCLDRDVDTIPSLTPEGRERLIRKRKRIIERAIVVERMSQGLILSLKTLGYDVNFIDELYEKYGRTLSPEAIELLVACIEGNKDKCLAADSCSGENAFFHSLLASLTGAVLPFDGAFLGECYDRTFDLQIRFTILQLVSMGIVTGIEGWLIQKANDPDDPDFSKTLESLRG